MGDASHQARKSDHNDGNAVDVSHDPGAGCSGDIISAHALTDARTKYVIWNRRINTLDGRGWRTYTGKNGHTHHCHISIKATARDDIRSWGWANAGAPVPSVAVAQTAPVAAGATPGTAAGGGGAAAGGAAAGGATGASAAAHPHAVAAAHAHGVPARPSPPDPPPPATITPYVYPGAPVEIGARGLHVQRIQMQLKNRGWEITVDAIFGPITKHLVKRFQDRRQLVADGIVGPRTWRELWR